MSRSPYIFGHDRHDLGLPEWINRIDAVLCFHNDMSNRLLWEEYRDRPKLEFNRHGLVSWQNPTSNVPNDVRQVLDSLFPSPPGSSSPGAYYP